MAMSDIPEGEDLKHVCHADGCTEEIPREHLFCFSHWSMLPRLIRRRVWRYYVKGQCSDRTLIKPEWQAAAQEAIAYVREVEEYRKKEGF